MAYLHIILEPLQAKRHVRITQQHTMQDFVHCMKWLVDDLYPGAKVIRVVLDNLATHKPAALYRVFPPDEFILFNNLWDFSYACHDIKRSAILLLKSGNGLKRPPLLPARHRSLKLVVAFLWIQDAVRFLAGF
jgi:hypothetical protein